MSGLVNKIKSFVASVAQEHYGEEVYEDLYEAEAEEAQEDITPSHNSRKRPNLKVLTHPSAVGSYEVRVIEPRSFEESLDIVNNLRDKKSIILNLHLLDAEQSQRIVDFLAGATHAIDGHQQRIGEGVFIFTPNNVSISSETEKARVIRDAFWNQAR
ncbi:MAG: cell division protein SepF [bacterium]